MGVSYLKMPDGKAVTIVNSAKAIEEKKLAREAKQKIHVYDLMTGVIISENPAAKEYPYSLERNLEPLTKLYDAEGKQTALVIGMESKKDGRVLPFEYYRIQYTADNIESGDFLFNEKKELVAIVYTADNKYKTQGYATPIAAALREYEDFTKNGKIRRCWIGTLTSRSVSLSEIQSVRPDLPAANAGIQKGDILLSVGDQSISTFHEYVDAFFYLVDGKPEKFTFLRGAEVKEVTLTPAVR